MISTRVQYRSFPIELLEICRIVSAPDLLRQFGADRGKSLGWYTLSQQQLGLPISEPCLLSVFHHGSRGSASVIVPNCKANGKNQRFCFE